MKMNPRQRLMQFLRQNGFAGNQPFLIGYKDYDWLKEHDRDEEGFILEPAILNEDVRNVKKKYGFKIVK